MYGRAVILFVNDTATTEIYTLSLHDALPICGGACGRAAAAEACPRGQRRGVRRRGGVHLRHRLRGRGGPRSEEHTSELQSRQYLVCRLLLEKQNTHILFFTHLLTLPSTAHRL